MARRIVHQLVDDLDGTVLEPGDGETVLFSLDGAAYEIDLTDAHAGELRAALAPYIDAGRRVTAASGSSSASGGQKRRRGGQIDYGPIREWARANGHKVSDRGRVPQSVIDAYDAAH